MTATDAVTPIASGKVNPIRRVTSFGIKSQQGYLYWFCLLYTSQGINKYDDITTLGRGGSDTSAVALAAALHADLCQIYTCLLYTSSRKDRLFLVLFLKKTLHKQVIDRIQFLVRVWGGQQFLAIFHDGLHDDPVSYTHLVFAKNSYAPLQADAVIEVSSTMTASAWRGA